jgi:hypothetical protein
LGNPAAVNAYLDEVRYLCRAGHLGGARAPPTRRATLDIDSSESPVHGAQEQSVYDGHLEPVCYHPLFVFNQDGDCLAATLRSGNVPSAYTQMRRDYIARRFPSFDDQQADWMRSAREDTRISC